jgi:hypothetical protein
MDARVLSRGVVFARGAAVLAGWQVLLVGAAVLWWLGLSDAQPPADCQDDGLGFNCAASDRELVAMGALFVGVPALLAAVGFGTAVASALAAARVRSGILIGTAGAFAGWLAVVAYVWSH